MLLRRTRAKLKHHFKEKIFSLFHLKSMIDENEKRALEDHMGFRGQWEEHRRFQIDELTRRGLTPDNSLLEIGCGPLTAGVPIIRYLKPGHYVGIDVRPDVLNLSWQEIGKNRLSERNPQLICTDDFGEIALGTRAFDFIWSFSVLYHLSDEILDACFAAVSKRLAPNGRYYANVMVDMENSTWLQFPFLRRTVQEYEAVAQRHGLSVSDHGSIASLGFRLGGLERENRFLEIKHGCEMTEEG